MSGACAVCFNILHVQLRMTLSCFDVYETPWAVEKRFVQQLLQTWPLRHTAYAQNCYTTPTHVLNLRSNRVFTSMGNLAENLNGLIQIQAVNQQAGALVLAMPSSLPSLYKPREFLHSRSQICTIAAHCILAKKLSLFPIMSCRLAS